MNPHTLLSPPIAFILIAAVVTVVAAVLTRTALRARKTDGAGKAYACGESFDEGHLVQPDYSQFFPFAFFFTLLHVVALMIATVPRTTTEILAIAVVYLAGAVVSLLILLRR